MLFVWSGLAHIIGRQRQKALESPEALTEAIEVHRAVGHFGEVDRPGFRSNFTNELQLLGGVLIQVMAHRVHPGDRRQSLQFGLDRRHLGHGGNHHDSKQYALRPFLGGSVLAHPGRFHQFLFEDHRREPVALHVEQVVVEGHPQGIHGADCANAHSGTEDPPGAFEPEAFGPLPPIGCR